MVTCAIMWCTIQSHCSLLFRYDLVCYVAWYLLWCGILYTVLWCSVCENVVGVWRVLCDDVALCVWYAVFCGAICYRVVWYRVELCDIIEIYCKAFWCGLFCRAVYYGLLAIIYQCKEDSRQGQ